MITTIIILSILLLVSLFIIVNLLKKVERIDEELEVISTNLEDVVRSLLQAKSTMNKIDSKGWFKNDDETGTVFNGINDVITRVIDNLNMNIDEK